METALWILGVGFVFNLVGLVIWVKTLDKDPTHPDVEFLIMLVASVIFPYLVFIGNCVSWVKQKIFNIHWGVRYGDSVWDRFINKTLKRFIKGE